MAASPRPNGMPKHEWRGNHLHLCTATYIFTDTVKFLVLAFVIVTYLLGKDLSDAQRHSSCLSLSLDHLSLIKVIFTTECRNTLIHRVTSAHACIDRPFMQSMGLHTRTQRMLGTPQILSSNSEIEGHQVDKEERLRPPRRAAAAECCCDPLH